MISPLVYKSWYHDYLLELYQILIYLLSFRVSTLPFTVGSSHLLSFIQASVRLHNPSSGNFIGEVFYAKHVDQSTMQFELVKRAGLRLRVTERGTVGKMNL